MTTAIQPLLVLSPERIQDELRRALAVRAAAAHDRRRIMRLVALCVSDYVIGLVAIGWSVHVTDADLAPVLFYAGVLRAVGWPAWRVILAVWWEANR